MLFDGFIAKDFDAYVEAKWQSNAYNLERLRVKQKLSALGQCVAPHLHAADGSLLTCEVSSEHPAIWNQHRVDKQYLFFSRNELQRRELDKLINRQRTMASMIEDPTPLRNHIFLGVVLSNDGIEVALKLHADASVDRENLVRKTHDYFLREKLLHAICTLPPEFQVGLIGSPLTSASALDDDGLTTLIKAFVQSKTWMIVGAKFPCAAMVDQGTNLVDLIRNRLERLLPIFHYIGWSRDNDYVLVKETLKEEEVRHKSKGLIKNDKVRVVRGMFTGKTGVVQEIDTKGAIKVMLGKVAVKLTGEDVVKT